MKKKYPALILIDIQKGFEDNNYWGNRNNPDAEFKASELLKHWRIKRMPVFHIKHCSTNPKSVLAEGKIGNEFQSIVQPTVNETVIKKEVSSAFIGTNLQEQLNLLNIDTLVIVGLTTDHCISTSVRMAGNLGFETIVVSDATATFDKRGLNGENYDAELIHQTALASLNEEFAQVLSSEEVILKYSS